MEETTRPNQSPQEIGKVIFSACLRNCRSIQHLADDCKCWKREVRHARPIANESPTPTIPGATTEWAAIKRVGKEPKILDEPGLERHAVKVVSMILQQLPPNHEYKVLFMTRPLEEVVASQAAMIERLGAEGAEMDGKQLEGSLAAHRDTALAWLKACPRIEVVEIDYTALVQSPDESIAHIAEFPGRASPHVPTRMCSVIDGSLYRKRKLGQSSDR